MALANCRYNTFHIIRKYFKTNNNKPTKNMKSKFMFSLMMSCGLFAAAQGYQDGVDNFNAGRLDVAKAILNNTINDASTNKAESYYYLGEIDLREGNTAAAQANFQKGTAASPTYPYNYVGMGEISLRAGLKADAEKCFKEATSFDKKNTAVLAAVARAYYNVDPVKYAKEIEKNINKALKDSKNTEAAVYVLQGDMTAAENPGDAAGLYEMAITQDAFKNEVNREAYVKYANTYFHVNPRFAIQKLEEFNEKAPNSALAQRELAEKYYDNNQFGSACIQYGKYMQNPNHFQSDEQRYAGLLYSAGEYDKSLEIANRVLAQDPSNFYMHRVIMLDKVALNDYAGAEAAGQELFRNPNAQLIANDYILFGKALSEQGKIDDAVVYYEKAIELNPDKPEILTDLSAVYEKAGDSEKAVETMKRYLDAGNGKTNDLYNMARRYRGLALKKEAGSQERVDAANEGVKYINMAIEKVPDNGALWRTKGELLLTRNDNKIDQEIADTYLKMLSIYDQDATNKEKYASTYRAAYFILGNFYVDTDKPTAKEYYIKYLEVTPEGDEAVQNMIDNL